MKSFILYMKMKKGIICIETEWQVTSRSSRRDMDTNSMLRFLHEVHQIPFIYRRVATEGELSYYLKEFGKSEYPKKYSIIYFSFHGNTHTIRLEGDNKELTLTDLASIGGAVFSDRLVHFSSCKTLLKSDSMVNQFKEETGAKLVSGYSKSVDTMMSAILDLGLFDAFFTYKQIPAIIRRIKSLYGGLSQELGFTIY